MAIQWVDPYLNTLSGGGNGTTGSGSGTYASPYTLRQAFSDNTVFNSFSDGDEIRLKGLSESTFFPTQTTYDLTSSYSNTYNDGTYDYHRRFLPNDSSYKINSIQAIEFYRMRAKFSNKTIYGWTNNNGEFCTLWSTEYRHPLYGQLDETYGAYKFDVTNYGLKLESDGNPIFWTSGQGNGYALYDLTVPNLYITSGWDSEITQNGVTVLVNTDTYYGQGSNTSSASFSKSSQLKFGRESETNTNAEWLRFDSSNYNTLIWGLRDSIHCNWYVNEFHAKAYCSGYSSNQYIFCGKQWTDSTAGNPTYWGNRKEQQGNCTIGVSTHGYAPGIRLVCGVNSSTSVAEDVLYKVEYLSCYDHQQNQVLDYGTSTGTNNTNKFTFTYQVKEQYTNGSPDLFIENITSDQSGPKIRKIQYDAGYNWETGSRYFNNISVSRLPNVGNTSTYWTHLDVTGERTVTRGQRNFPPAAGQSAKYRWYDDEANWGMQNQASGFNSLSNNNANEGTNQANWENRAYSEYFWTKKTWETTNFGYRDRVFIYNWTPGSFDFKTHDKFPIAFNYPGRQFNQYYGSTLGRTGDFVIWAADNQNPIRLLTGNFDDSSWSNDDWDKVGSGYAEFNDIDNSNKKTWILYRSWPVNNITKYIYDYHWFSLPDWSSNNLTFAASFSAADSNNISLRLKFYVYSTSTKKFELLRTLTPTASNNAWTISETFTTADLTSANAIAYGDMCVAIGAYPLNNTTSNEKLVWESQPTLT